jgi:hypothetical protein
MVVALLHAAGVGSNNLERLRDLLVDESAAGH